MLEQPGKPLAKLSRIAPRMEGRFLSMILVPNRDAIAEIRREEEKQMKAEQKSKAEEKPEAEA